MPLVHVQLIHKVRKWDNSLLHHFNHYHRVIFLQHREAIDQETQTAHIPPRFCTSHWTPGPLLPIAIFFINGNFVFLSLCPYLDTWSYLSLVLKATTSNPFSVLFPGEEQFYSPTRCKGLAGQPVPSSTPRPTRPPPPPTSDGLSKLPPLGESRRQRVKGAEQRLYSKSCMLTSPKSF